MEPESAEKQPYEVVSFRDKTSLMNSGAIIEYFDDEIRIKYSRPPWIHGCCSVVVGIFFVVLWLSIPIQCVYFIVFPPNAAQQLSIQFGVLSVCWLAAGALVGMVFWKYTCTRPTFFDEEYVLFDNHYTLKRSNRSSLSFSYSDFKSLTIFAYLVPIQKTLSGYVPPTNYDICGTLFVGVVIERSQYLRLPWRSPVDVFKNYQSLDSINQMSILIERIHQLTGIPIHQLEVVYSETANSRSPVMWPAFGKRTGLVVNAPLIINRDEWPSNDE